MQTTGQAVLGAFVVLAAVVRSAPRDDGPMVASPAQDPACWDSLNSGPETMYRELAAHGAEPMRNAFTVNNTGELPTFDDAFPAPRTLAWYEAFWALGDRPRNYALIVMDMEACYEALVVEAVPRSRRVLDRFRRLELPVVWTNWARRWDDMAYGALDRFFGPQGVANKENPQYSYDEEDADGTATVPLLAPVTASERRRSIKSLHLSKFADKFADGSEILDPMLRAWGVDTLVIVGAWSEDCILSTITDAVDRYGYDVVLVEDAVATGSDLYGPVNEVLRDTYAKLMRADAVLDALDNEALIARPKAPLDPAGFTLRPRGAAASAAMDLRVPAWLAVATVAATALVAGSFGWFAARGGFYSPCATSSLAGAPKEDATPPLRLGAAASYAAVPTVEVR